jgi:hypothetical protein
MIADQQLTLIFGLESLRPDACPGASKLSCSCHHALSLPCQLSGQSCFEAACGRRAEQRQTQIKPVPTPSCSSAIDQEMKHLSPGCGIKLLDSTPGETAEVCTLLLAVSAIDYRGLQRIEQSD